ncbi:M13 family metallopeptidase [Methyloversatilis sp.]|uniref:M13 family metallopeptidase n=1 Tax=Methyloversatilis sp. TaxID=2569862 RepID=UPI0035AE36CF
MKVAVLASLFSAGLLFAQVAAAGSFPADVPALGYSPANMDRTADPRKDFYRYAAGNWLRKTDIPATDPDVGGFSLLAHNLNGQLLGLVRAAAAAPDDRRDRIQQQVGDFYRAAMDTERLDALGIEPLKADLTAIGRVEGAAALGVLVAQLQSGFGASPLINATVGTDEKQSDTNVLKLFPGIRALNQDEYAKPEGQVVRDLYLDYIASMFRTLGDSPEQAQANARTVLAIETELAAAELTVVARSDPGANYHKLTFAEAQALIPAIDLGRYLGTLGVTPPDTLLVPDPAGLRAVQKVVAERPVDELRTLLRWHVLSARASALGQPWYGLDQTFSLKRQGLASARPREQEVTDMIGQTLFHPLSQLYVKAFFPESTRRDIVRMVGHIKDEFALRLRRNRWLDDATRKAALEKLARLDVAVGYPEQWIDFGSVDIRPDDHFGNVRRVDQFLQTRSLARLGQAVVPERFDAPGETTPIAVNAGYQPQRNNVDITAAIVQPPFYVPGADAAVNYCTIGAVIGHELTHGFDSQGRQFGPTGDLHDWWTPRATQRFERRTEVLVRQYSGFEILPGLMHNGRQTLGENTADLGGITLAHAALRRHLGNNPLPKIDGLTSDQRCFVAWSQMWAYKARSERLRLLVSLDVHAISSVRAVAPLMHLDAFHKAFGTRRGDPMWRAPEDRVTIW